MPVPPGNPRGTSLASQGVFDLADPQTMDNPYPAYRWLRDEAPVHLWRLKGHPREGIWLVSRYSDVGALLADDRCSKRGGTVGIEDSLPPMLMFLDPPEHSRIRKPVVTAFSPRRVEMLQDAIAEKVEELIAPIIAGVEVDVVETVALPLPLVAICRLLGVPVSDSDFLHEVTGRILDGEDAASAVDKSETARDEEELLAYMRALVERRQLVPSPDLLSALLHPDEGVGALSPDQAALMGIQLFVNGHETTVNLIGTALLYLLRHRAQWESLCEDPSLADSAVEEALRFDAPNQRSGARYAVEDLEFAGGSVPAGAQVAGVIGAANRDERAFDRPDDFDITRDPNPHLSFGRGRHRCPGASLTRAEVAEVLRQLAQGAPDLQLMDPAPRYKPNSFDRGLTSLTVRRDVHV